MPSSTWLQRSTIVAGCGHRELLEQADSTGEVLNRSLVGGEPHRMQSGATARFDRG